MRSITLMALIMVLSASAAFADEQAAILKVAQGAVDLQRGERTLHPAPGDSLLVGDILRTGQDGSAGVMFLDGTRIGLGPSSEMSLKAYRFSPAKKDYAFDVFMNKGSAAYTSGKLGKMAPEAVKFSTPNATVGIRGTKFLVKVD
ncbi:MAG: FecR domain-containing protein [Deltaproteobacteria bacterium]|nr:FecR domain-containing protein [Deltaproteobacteria bacterium]